MHCIVRQKGLSSSTDDMHSFVDDRKTEQTLPPLVLKSIQTKTLHLKICAPSVIEPKAYPPSLPDVPAALF